MLEAIGLLGGIYLAEIEGDGAEPNVQQSNPIETHKLSRDNLSVPSGHPADRYEHA